MILRKGYRVIGLAICKTCARTYTFSYFYRRTWSAMVVGWRKGVLNKFFRTTLYMYFMIASKEAFPISCELEKRIYVPFKSHIKLAGPKQTHCVPFSLILPTHCITRLDFVYKYITVMIIIIIIIWLLWLYVRKIIWPLPISHILTHLYIYIYA
jgi:hypothetical protein